MNNLLNSVAPLLAEVQKYSITCEQVGNCNAKSPTLDWAFANVANAIVGLVGGLALIFLIVSALQMVLSNGDPKRFAQGRQGLLYAVVGVGVALSAYAIIFFVTAVFK